MTAIPNTVALATIPDGSLEVAVDHRNNYAAIQTAVNGLIAALSGGSQGQVLEALSSTSVDWLGGTYQAYVPSWTAAGVAPAIGNAVVVARFARLGKVVHAYGQITFGTTSTFGTGRWAFALPVAASASMGQIAEGCGSGYDTSADMALTGVEVDADVVGGPMRFFYNSGYLSGNSAFFSVTTPWTWATGDFIRWNILYEAA